MYEAFDLTATQKKAFEDLKKAYQRCQRSGILFVNHYSHLVAFNKTLVHDYTDSITYDGPYDEKVIKTRGQHVLHSFRIPGEWADDEHLIILTDRGLKVHRQDNEL